jgi:hypothetical protein
MAEHYWPGAVVEGGTPPGPAYDATFVALEAPETMVSGERAMVWVELENTGRATWDLSATRLGTTNPRDRDSAFYDAENWVSPNRASAPDHSTYSPGTTGRFTFMITAPAVTEETVVTETFGLVQELVTWFGPEDVTVSIRVRPRTTEPTPDPDPTPDPMPDPMDPMNPMDPTDPTGRPGTPGLERGDHRRLQRAIDGHPRAAARRHARNFPPPSLSAAALRANVGLLCGAGSV